MEYPDVPSHSPSPSATPRRAGAEGEGEAEGGGSGGDSPTQIPSRPASPDLPLTMTASAILTALPRDASSALASASTALAPPTTSTSTSPSTAAARGAGSSSAATASTATPTAAGAEAEAAAEADRKVVVRFKAVGGGAPTLRREVRKVSAAQRFEAVVVHLRRALRLPDAQGLFCYVNSAFAPALDEVVGNLHRVRSCSLLPRSVFAMFPSPMSRRSEYPVSSSQGHVCTTCLTKRDADARKRTWLTSKK